MVRSTLVAISLAAAFNTNAFAQAQRPAAAPDPAAIRREIESLNRGMEDAMKRGDTKAAAAYYADDAQVRSARGSIVQGRAAIDQYFASIGNADWKLEVFDVGGDPNSPYQIGRSTLTRPGSSMSSVVSFVLYWKRQPNGQLKILLDYYH